MHTVGFEQAIADFLALGRRLQSAQPLTGAVVLEQLTTWYRSGRIRRAELQDDGDMLLLQWGAIRPPLLAEPVDLRKMDVGALKFAQQDRYYLDFTRQVFAPESPDDEFDDYAVQLSIQLTFGPAEGRVGHSNLWIATPDQVDAGKTRFVADPFVQARLHVPAEAMTVTAGLCG